MTDLSEAERRACRAQRLRTGRAALQGLVFIAAVYAPTAGLVTLPASLDPGSLVVADLVAAAAGLLALGVVFALIGGGTVQERLVRSGQFAVAVVALWTAFAVLAQTAG